MTSSRTASTWYDDLSGDYIRPRRRRRRGLMTLLVTLIVLGLATTLAFQALRPLFHRPVCRATPASGPAVSFGPEATSNAATIAGISVRRELPTRAATIAIATAIQESKLINLEYGDRDSLGLFQQRPSQGWGTPTQILDPVYASEAFYTRLVKVRDWQTRELTVVAQAVQRSGFPEAYAEHETEASALAGALTGARPFALGCRLEPATSRRDTNEVTAELRRTFGTGLPVDASLGGDVAGVEPGQARNTARLVITARDNRHAAALAAWAVAHAEHDGILQVSTGDRMWTRSEEDSALSWTSAPSAQEPSTVALILGVSANG